MHKNLEGPRQAGTERRNFTPEELFRLAEKQIPAYMADAREFSHIEEFSRDQLARVIRIFFLDIGYTRPSERTLSPEKQEVFDAIFDYFVLPQSQHQSVGKHLGKIRQKKFDFE